MKEEQVSPTSSTEVTSDIQLAADALSELSNRRDPLLARQLARLVGVVAREATKSPRLAKALSSALDLDTPDTRARVQRPRRRGPAVLDPFAIHAEVGEEGLRKQLNELDLEKLRDILAEHRLDHDRLAMKWKDPTRVVDRIIERVTARASKGSAFRS